MKNNLKNILDKLNYFIWNEDSFLYRMVKKHPFFVYILLVPLIIIVILITIFLGPTLFIVVTIIRFIIRSFSHLKNIDYKQLLNTFLFLVLQISLSFIILYFGYYMFRVFIFILHETSIINNKIIIYSFSLLCFSLIMLIAILNWTTKEDISKINLEKEKDKTMYELNNVDKGKYHPLFTNSKYIGYRKRIMEALSIKTMITLLNVSLCLLILLSAFVCHEVYLLTNSTSFTGVNDAISFRQWVYYIFSLVIDIFPLDIVNIFKIELTEISPSPLFGTILVIIINSAIAFIFLIFFYSLISRIYLWKMNNASSRNIKV